MPYFGNKSYLCGEILTLIHFLFMKKLFLFLILFSAIQIGYAQQQSQAENNKEKTTVLDRRLNENPKPLRTPSRTELVLVLEEFGITIRFNGDFGEGTYQLSDTSTGYTVTNTVVATAGSTEFVPFMISETGSYNFYIEFEDGSWSQLSWGEL